jgi:hypothetical protein
VKVVPKKPAAPAQPKPTTPETKPQTETVPQ